MKHIIGHTSIIQFFESVIDAGAMHHAYCFVGREHVGKKTMAIELAAQLLQTTREKVVNHPDWIYIAQEKNEKTGKTKKNIDIDQIRTIKEHLSRRAAMGGYRIAVIDGAEKMNRNAGNALLKTLEEPGKQTVLFLLTTDEQQLLPTILSRSQRIFFAPVHEEILYNGLCETGVEESDAHLFARDAYGLPGKALLWAQHRETYDIYKKTISDFCSLFGKPLYEKMKTVEPLFGDKSDHIETRHYLYETLSVWQLVLRDVLPSVGMNQAPAYLPTVTKKQVLDIFAEIDKAKYYIQKNIHPKLLIEHILLRIP